VLGICTVGAVIWLGYCDLGEADALSPPYWISCYTYKRLISICSHSLPRNVQNGKQWCNCWLGCFSWRLNTWK
jgi:hypothetical protein